MPGSQSWCSAGTGSRPVPRVRPPAGRRRMPADRPTSASGVAERQRDETRALARLHPQQHRVLAAALRGLEVACATSPGLGDRLAADVENDVADLEAVSAATPSGSTAVTTHAVASAPATCCSAQASGRACGTALLEPVLAGCVRTRLLLLVRQRAERQRRRSSARAVAPDRSSFDRAARGHARRSGAPVRADRRPYSPSTAVMTSPLSMPGLGGRAVRSAASATSAPAAFFRPRLSAISGVTGWICDADPAAGDAALVA